MIAKSVHGQFAADVPPADIVRQVALFGAHNRDGWGRQFRVIQGDLFE